MIKWLEKRRFISFLLTILIAIEIYYFSSLESTGITISNPWPSRIYHSFVFFLFSTFLFILIKGENKINRKKFMAVLIISILYAILDEIHQIFVPGRDANIEDFLTDSAGIFSSMIICSYIGKKTESSLKKMLYEEDIKNSKLYKMKK